MQQENDNQESGWKTASGRKNRHNKRSEYGRKDRGYKEDREDRGTRRLDRNKSHRTWSGTNQDTIQKSKIYKSKQPCRHVYKGPNYSELISSLESNESNDNETIDNSHDTDNRSVNIINIPKVPGRLRKSVRNQNPRPNKNVSYDRWECTYFKHILALHDIFTRCIDDLGIPGVDTKSAEFLNIFANFIRDCSSGEVSPYIEELTEYESNLYLEYMIKRNEQ